MMFRSRFDATTEASAVAKAYRDEIEGRAILITGVSLNGLGAAVCEAVAVHAPRLLVLCGRSMEKPQAVANDLMARHPDVKIRVVAMDLSSNSSVKRAASDIEGYVGKHIDILINNAGVMCIPNRRVNEDGIETHLASNYLGHFLLTKLLLSKLQNSTRGGRVVNVTSSAHIISPFRFSDPGFGGEELERDEEPVKDACDTFETQWTTGYSPLIAYAQSKTAGILHSVALAQSTVADGLPAFSVDPGVIRTDLWRQMQPDVVQDILSAMPTKSQSQGASTILVAALDPDLKGFSGAYLQDCAIASAAAHATDVILATKLWSWSETVCG